MSDESRRRGESKNVTNPIKSIFAAHQSWRYWNGADHNPVDLNRFIPPPPPELRTVSKWI